VGVGLGVEGLATAEGVGLEGELGRAGDGDGRVKVVVVGGSFLAGDFSGSGGLGDLVVATKVELERRGRGPTRELRRSGEPRLGEAWKREDLTGEKMSM